MGICDSTTKNKSRRETHKTSVNTLAKADPNSSQSFAGKNVDEKIRILQSGNIKEIERMIDQSIDDINSYCFGSNKTLLLEAVICCSNPKVVDLIMKKGAKIDLKEKETGNTALFLSAIDLKVEFVKTLLEYSPNLTIKNNAQQTVIQFLEFQLMDQRKSLKREMTRNEKNDYDIIMELLRKNSGKDEEKLDDSNNSGKKKSKHNSEEFL